MLLLRNADVARVLTMADSLAAMDEVYADIASGDATGLPRTDVYTPSDRPPEADPAPFHRWAVMTGNWRRRGYLCARMMSDMVDWPLVDGVRRETKWAVAPGTYSGLLFLYSTHNGEPLAILHDGIAQHHRVGAGAGLGTRLLSREDSATIGMLGSGGMARSYLEALLEIRPIRRVRVFSPNAANRAAYAAEMAAAHGVEVTPVDSAREAVAGADIVALCVSAVEPVFFPDWLEPGMHVVDVTRPSTPRDFPRSVDLAFWHGNATPVLAEPLPPTAMYARGGYLSWVAGQPAETAVIPQVAPNPVTFGMPTLADLLAGRTIGRTSAGQTSFFHNIGAIGPGFAAIAGTIYEKAKAAGVGQELPTDWFLEDIRD
jgi:alanine dehydrogenase